MIDMITEQVIKNYFESKYPQEACGIVLKDMTFIPCDNIADDVYNHFEIDTYDYMKHEGNILAIVHSHPDGNDGPSKLDMKSQVATNVPFGLCVTRQGWTGPLWFFGDGIPEVDLVGRPFRHGPTGTDGKGDCFALIRDYYKTLGIKLNEYPRDHQWWDKGEDMYESYFENEGFVEIHSSEVKDNDSFMMAVNSKVINHAGVFVGNNLILHHLANRVSRHEPVGRWPKMIVKWVRHRDLC